MRVYKLIRAEAREQMSSQDRPEAAATASAPAREPETKAAEPRAEGSASAGTARDGATTDSTSAITQLGGRRHQRRRHRTGGERSSSERGERELPAAAPAARPQQQSERELNLDELRELSELIDAHNFTEFEIEREGFRLRISKHNMLAPPTAHAGAQPFVPPAITPLAPPATLPQTAGAPATTIEPSAQATETMPAPAVAELHKITSPIVGTFYRAASPTTGPFVEVGSRVRPDTVVCIIEAMKLMNEILADVSGTVEEVYVENGQPVEFGQALFGVRQ
jgi:acetyl-CoA carboxylase biotin carboxyl carrier protein